MRLDELVDTDRTALFPLTSETELAGGSGENEVSGAVNDQVDNGWPIVAIRVQTIPEYGQLFVEAVNHLSTSEDVRIPTSPTPSRRFKRSSSKVLIAILTNILLATWTP